STSANSTRQFDHAWEGQSGVVRIGDDGMRAGDWQRRDDYLGRRQRQLRAQRNDAGNGAQSPESIRLLANVVDVFCDKCVRGIVAREERCRELIELSMAMVTSLAPKIGYDRAAEIAKESAKTGRTIREIAREKKILPDHELEEALDPIKMTEPRGARAK